MAKGYVQQQGIDYTKVCTHVARVDTMRMIGFGSSKMMDLSMSLISNMPFSMERLTRRYICRVT